MLGGCVEVVRSMGIVRLGFLVVVMGSLRFGSGVIHFVAGGDVVVNLGRNRKGYRTEVDYFVRSERLVLYSVMDGLVLTLFLFVRLFRAAKGGGASFMASAYVVENVR